MGSTFISIDKIDSESKKIFGDTRPQPVYLQFVHGIVGEVITGYTHPSYIDPTTGVGNPRRINSIYALPHYGTEIKKLSMLDEANIYYPIFRGMTDVPVAGDQVMLATMGGVQYYLGPINTTNSPNWNIDIDHYTRAEPRGTGGYEKETTQREQTGLSKGFDDITVARLQKWFNAELDSVRSTESDIHGDMMFEGRHGNSIRIGSRSVNPYIIISNGRNPSSVVEGANDGSIFSMFSYGTVRQHFPLDAKLDKDKIVSKPWTLASDERDKPKRIMSNLVSLVNNSMETNKLIYSYGNATQEPISSFTNQTLLNSDRITINAKRESLFFSAFQDINIGSGKDITISSNGDIVIDAERTFFGSSQYSEPTQGLVMGENLRTILEELVDALMQANFQCQGAPLKLGSMASGGAPGSMEQKLKGIKNKLTEGSNDFVSKKHFIELN
tara:strand:- start:2232 stop:3557 length:1326 start_codon:yes stop_codon:yes gene_type:complete